MLMSMPEDQETARRVLVADDEPHIARIISIVLTKNGNYEVVGVMDGQQAIEAIDSDERGFDLFLVDQMMPHQTGTQVIEYLRNTERYADTPAFIITAREQTRLADVGEGVGATALLTKPFSPKGLKHEIDALFEDGPPSHRRAKERQVTVPAVSGAGEGRRRRYGSNAFVAVA